MSFAHAPARATRLVFLLLAAALPDARLAMAQAVCGGTVGPGGTVTMTSDIVDCAVDPALRVVGKVVLDMAGHLVTCDAGAPFVVGISVEGKGATVRNGTVGGCGFPVSVGGSGQHKLRNVMVFGGLVGIAVTSSRNEITGSGVSEAGANGFSVSGDDNDLADNMSSLGEIGFLVQGLRNSLDRNVASSNDVGFEASGSSRTQLTRNIAQGNGVGFRVAAASSEVTLKQNVATGSETGFDVGGSGHDVSGNTSVQHGSSGFLVSAGAGGHRLRDNVAIGAQALDTSRGFIVAEGGGNELRGNRAMNHLHEGIWVGSQSNVIRDSVALGNSPDLADDNPGCDDNQWTSNVGGKNQPCIR